MFLTISYRVVTAMKRAGSRIGIALSIVVGVGASAAHAQTSSYNFQQKTNAVLKRSTVFIGTFITMRRKEFVY